MTPKVQIIKEKTINWIHQNYHLLFQEIISLEDEKTNNNRRNIYKNVTTERDWVKGTRDLSELFLTVGCHLQLAQEKSCNILKVIEVLEIAI